METDGKRVAVIGAGVAGITAAHLLQRRHDVVLFEKENRLGGHTNTVALPDGPDAGTPIDTGFIVCNDWTYPNFLKLLGELDVPVRDSDMSFSFNCLRSGLEYAGTNLNTLFAQRRNLLSPPFWRMLLDIIRFNRNALAALESGRLHGQTLGGFVEAGAYSRRFTEHYLLPMGAAIWSTPSAEMLRFPAEAFVKFCRNHGLLNIEHRPTWKTVVGGSISYLRAFEKRFRGSIRLSSPVAHVRRENGRIVVRPGNSPDESFDAVVIASHADEALAMLADPSDDERRLLGPWRYEENLTLLHSDPRVMPRARRAWSSWNYVREDGAADAAVSVTYHMNRLMGLTTRNEYFVTLNGARPPQDGSVVRKMVYTHPTYTFDSLGTQAQLPRLQGVRGTYFCGSYHGFGFHEDAVSSGLAVAAQFGESL